MYDQWIEQVDTGMMVGVSANFDMVDHELRLEKLKLFGLTPGAVAWFRSYPSNRSKTVCVDGCLSSPLELDCGDVVCLRAPSWVLYIPELVHEYSSSLDEQHSCKSCGISGIVYYAGIGFGLRNNNTSTCSNLIDTKLIISVPV